MIQKLKEYQVNRAVKGYNAIGEYITLEPMIFYIKMAVSVASGSTATSNLVQSTNSTHTGVYFKGSLKVGDIIKNGAAAYRVTYVYPDGGKKKICNLQMVQNG